MRQLLMFSPPQPLLPAWIGELGLIVAMISTVGLVHALYMRWRNHRVYKLRTALIAVVTVASKMDAELGRDYAWRMAVLDSVTYNDMLLKFWRPLRLNAFYQDLSFLMPPIATDNDRR